MVAIDERLKKLRYELGLDWGELAKTLEISRSMLGFVRHGTKPVSAKLLYRITQLEKKSQLGSTQIAPHAAEQVATVRESSPAAASPPLRVRDERDDAYGSPECLRRENAELRERLAGCERREAELLEIIRNLTAPGNAGRASASTEEKQS